MACQNLCCPALQKNVTDGKGLRDVEKIVRRKIKFYGSVQGVGFRFRAKYAAECCGVVGWVRNEWDGSVEMEAQGTEEDIQEMINKIRAGRHVDVSDIASRDIPVEDGDSGFHIKH